MNDRILYIGGFELPDKNAAAHRVLSNGKLFRDLGYRVRFLGVSRDGIRRGRAEGFDFDAVDYPSGVGQWIGYLSGKGLMEYVGEYSPFLIIAYNYPSLALYRLRRYCKSRGILLAADVTEWYGSGGNPVKWLDTAVRMRLVHKNLDGLIVISSYLENYYKDTPTVCLPPLVDPSDAKWSSDTTVEDNCDDNLRKLVYVGSPGRGGKDKLDVMIDALGCSREKIRFDIIGLTREEYCRSFGRSGEDIPDFVHFRGRVPHGQAIGMLKRSDFQIFLRDRSRVNNAGFPTKFVEAVSCGIPVITNLSSNLGDYLKDGYNGCKVDTSTDQVLRLSLGRAVGRSRAQIETMKENCRRDRPFDYGKYRDAAESFIAEIKKNQDGKE